MTNYKRLLLLSLALTSQHTLAGELGPIEYHGWEIGGHALYLQAYVGNNGLAYAESGSTSTLSAAPTLGSNLKYGWGFELEAGYHFNQPNDININWYELHNSQTTQQYITVPGNWVGPVGIHVNQLLQSGPVLLSMQPNWDAVNVEFGHSSNFDAVNMWRVHAGVEYARIQTQTFFTGTLLTSGRTTPAATTVNGSSTYNGFGPRFGVDFTRTLYKNSNIYAKGAGSVLAGANQYSANATNLGNNYYTYKTINNMTIVPEVDAKLGVNYAHSLQSGELVLDVGWLWVNYFDVVRAPTVTPILGNFGEQGLYFGLKWHGSVA